MKINKSYSGANIARTIRFTEKLFEQLNQVAFENEVSFNSVILQCCTYVLSHYKFSDN